jgi:Domain of unknown function (DUF4278)
MKLSYRGVTYEYVPPSLEVTEGEVRGSYRGAPWRCHTVSSTGRSAPVASFNSASSQNVPSHFSRALQVDHRRDQSGADPLPSLLPQVHRLHLANLERNIEHRLLVAKRQGDRALVSQLEEEFEQVLCRG